MSLELTPLDKEAVIWKKLRDYYANRLEILRAKNDAETLDEKQTYALRGRIAEVKLFLSLDSDKPEFK